MSAASNPRPANVINTGKCSTPFGINGIFTRRLFFPERYERNVLNAFRHQWNLYLNPSFVEAMMHYPCSTPFGINGIFTV